ncbi:MAG: hypothetical protein PWR20_2099 [Bacteroidales bacterium]|jgi:tetratricopeptide (TPR) repeat protein|nr:hypothetical protein [Bacteroidales bacterium]MDN5329273.1 hypothetical protein [Bacteroidales bacterium]
MRKTLILNVILGFILMAGNTVKAQSVEEAGTVFNEAIQLMQTDIAGAAAKFEEAIAICEKVGEEGNDIKTQAIAQIPPLYYNYAVKLQADGNQDGAISAALTAKEKAEKYGNADIKEKSIDLLTQLYYVKGNEQAKNNDFAGALASYDNALKTNPKFFRAIYGKAVVYMKQDSLENAEATYKELLTAVGSDVKLVKLTARNLGKKYSVAAAKAIKANKAAEALSMVEKALSYGAENANTYYYQLLAANQLKKWDLAIEAAQKALPLEEKDKNKIYFELGKAYEGKGNKVEACNAYKQVTAGPLVQNAQYQMKQVLKCN